MSRFWKAVVLIALGLAALLLITFLVPDINKFATDLAGKNKLPIWLVGLASPILYALSRFRDAIAGVMGDGEREKEIAEQNEAIKTKLAELEENVKDLDTWRKGEIDRRMKRIDEYDTAISAMQSREQKIDQSVGDLLQRREELKNVIREDPGTIE